jgi:hypothetical protein
MRYIQLVNFIDENEALYPAPHKELFAKDGFEFTECVFAESSRERARYDRCGGNGAELCALLATYALLWWPQK